MHPPFYGKGRLSLANVDWPDTVLTDKIRRRWAAVGATIRVWVDDAGAIRSDLVNALPTERTN